MNIAFKIIAFTFMLNIAAGILSNVNLMGWDVPWSVDQQMIDDINSIGNTSLENPPVQDQSNWFESFLEFLGLGFITKTFNIVSQYIYGIVNILQTIFPPEADPMFMFIRVLISFAYGWALFYMFTGKKVDEG